MKRSTPQLLIILAVLLFGLLPSKEAKATHAAGGELIYEWLGDSTYRFYFKFYRDCTGTTAPGTVNMCVFNTCTQTAQPGVLLTPVNCPPGFPGCGNAVSPGCAGYQTRCTDPQSIIPGYEEYWYTNTWTAPSRCISWRFGVTISARNSSYNLNSVQGLFYIETTMNNVATQSNSSPYFSVKPIPYTCINQPYTYNNGAVDPNGDSLVSEVINPMNTTACSQPHTFMNIGQTAAPSTPPIGFPNNPIQTGNTFALNAQTGQMTFTPLGPSSPAPPAASQGHTLTIRTLEYRNGILIGSIMRDIQVQVIPCTTTPSDVDIVPTSLVGAIWNPTLQRVEACVDQQYTFCFKATSIDTNAILVVEDNHTIIAPGSNVVYNNQLTDTVTGCFTWHPGFNDTGLKILSITVKDSTCKPPGILLSQTFTIPMWIWPATRAIRDTSICPLDSVSVLAIGGDNFQWTVAPGGSPVSSISNPNSANPKVRPALNTQYIVTSTINPHCKHIRDTVTVGVRPTPTIDAGVDTTTCIGSSLQLNVNVVQQPGLTYKIKWTPAIYLSDDTLFNPIATPKKDTTYYITVTSSDVNACKAYDTLRIRVLQGYNLLNNDTSICDGQSVQVNFTGDTRYSFVWTPPSGVSDPNSPNPVITPTGPIDTTKYTLTATYPGCNDSTRDFMLYVQPNPTVTVTTQDASLCYGDTVHISGVVTPNFPYTYNWKPGSTIADPNALSTVFTAYNTATLTLTATTSAGCVDSDDVVMTVNPVDFLVLSADTAICPGDTAQLSMTTANNTVLSSFAWTSTENISDVNSANPYVWPFTSTTYTAIGVDTNLCRDTQSVNVMVRPQATLSLPDSVHLYPGQTYQMDPTGNTMYHTWFPPLGLNDHRIANPTAKPEVNTRYVVQGYTEGGCSAMDSIEVIVMPESYIDVPNAFTPGSQPNATLKVVYRGLSKLKTFAVYNRWGTKVFETSDINAGWDGKFNGEPQPMGVYIYTVEGNTASGKHVNKQGNVTLLR